MKEKNLFIKILIILGIGILQYIAAMLVLFLFTLIFPSLDVRPESNPIIFIIVVGLCYSVGIFLFGWLSIKFNWRSAAHKVSYRLLFALIGIFIPLLLAFIVYPKLEPGNPFFFICIVTGILGFLLPEMNFRKRIL